MQPGVGSIKQRLRALDLALQTHSALWLPRPFRELELPWRHTHPQLHAWLLSLSGDQVELFENDHKTLCDALATFVPDLAELPALVDVPGTGDRPGPSAASSVALPTGFDWGIGGRKWAQVVAFADAIGAPPSAGHNGASARTSAHEYLDWCAGKAHLARYLAQTTGAPARALERNAELVAAGQALADRQHLPVTLHVQDVLHVDVRRHLTTRSHVLALHACGRLHVRLLRLAAEQALPRLSVAPCCHYLCDADDTALSQVGRSSPLQFTPEDLHLAVQETVTSGRSQQHLRARESAWRLGFDVLQRQLRGTDSYLNTPSAPRELLRTDFSTFVAWAAMRRGIALPAALPFGEFESIGHARHAAVTRLALVRHAFRRPLECLLIYDRAHYLEEQGYTVRVSAFCPRRVTPRNLLIDAFRAPA